MFSYYSLIYCTYTLFANEKQPNKYNKCQESLVKKKINSWKSSKEMEVTLSWQSKAIKQASLSERETGKTNDRSSGHTSQTAAKINHTKDTNNISSLDNILVGLFLLNQNIRLLYKSKQIRLLTLKKKFSYTSFNWERILKK